MRRSRTDLATVAAGHVMSCLMVAVTSLPAAAQDITFDPARVRLEVDDLRRLAHVVRSLEGGEAQDTAAVIEREYLGKASPGLRAYVRSYYDQADDKSRAIHDIVSLTDFDGFLQASRYEDRLLADLPTTGPLPVHDAFGPSAASELVRSLDSFFTRATRFGFSAVVLIAERGRVLLHEAYGLADRDAGIPLTPESSLHIGSVGKQFTAAAILRLEADGRLSTDDPLHRFFSDVPADKREVTLHHLLTHTSGLPFLTTRSFMEVRSRGEIMREMLELPLAFEPGSRYAYSNPGYALLAGVIEQASGESYEEYLATAIFQPANLANTGFVNDAARWADSPVRDYSGPEAQGQPLSAMRPLPKAVGAGSIVSTVEDLYRWDRALQGDVVLPESSRRRLFAPAAPMSEGRHYGYGWMIEQSTPGETIIYHAGDLGGYNAEVRRYVERDLVVIVSSNARAGSGYRVVAREALDRLLAGEELRLPPAVLSTAVDDLTALEGTYEVPSGGRIHVRARGAGLAIGGTGEPVLLALAGASDSVSTTRSRTLSERAATVAAALAAGDTGPLREHLHPGASFSTTSQWLLEAYASLADSLGAFRGVESLGTAVVSAAGARSYLELVYEHGVYPVVYRWNGEKITDIDASDAVPMETLFLPTGAATFTSHDLFTGRTLVARFEPGTHPRLTISGPGDPATGVRVGLPVH
jgi:CubicO group peptidase (beta-lactamase class C family)